MSSLWLAQSKGIAAAGCVTFDCTGRAAPVASGPLPSLHAALTYTRPRAILSKVDTHTTTHTHRGDNPSPDRHTKSILGPKY